jgi:hypothetical protein
MARCGIHAERGRITVEDFAPYGHAPPVNQWTQIDDSSSTF